MRLYNTVDDIKTEMEILYRNISGKPSFTAGEADIVYSAIVDAYQKAIQDYGVSHFRFQEADAEVDTVADQNYVNLDEYVYKVISGSVRIPAESALLGLIDEIVIFQSDPNDEETGIPTTYSYKSSGDANIMRLRLHPTPDAVYTINLKVLMFPSDIHTNFPTELTAAIKNKAKALSCLGLGLVNLKPAFDLEYEHSMAQIKDGYDQDTPRHVSRTSMSVPGRSVESRISG